jgi:alkylation response protein AidB-like acyl-CoA dehydrogenase
VPKANVVGAVGQGWTVAKHLLEFERGGSAYGPDLQVQLARLRAALADGRDHPGARRLDDAPFVARLAEIQMRVDVLERLELRMMSPAAGAPAEGLGASAMKVLGTELGQEVANLVMHAAGVRGLAYQPHAVTPAGDIAPQMASDGGPVSGAPWQALAALRMMNACLPPIFSGSNEIQRNIMARAILGPE